MDGPGEELGLEDICFGLKTALTMIGRKIYWVSIFKLRNICVRYITADSPLASSDDVFTYSTLSRYVTTDHPNALKRTYHYIRKTK